MNGKIKAKNSAWHFGKNIPQKFDVHIKKSVPQYERMQDLITNLSDFFLKKNSVCYDIGSSTGTLINKISNRHKDKKIQFYGVEIEKNMIKQAKKIKNGSQNNIKYLNQDIKKIKLKKNEMIISCYTMQFMDPKYRQDIINKIYKSLNWGGSFIMFEKIRASDPRFQDIFSQLYLDFKLKNKFSEKEIINKSRSLKGIMEPFSEYGNLGLLKRAGFVDIIPVMQWVNFKGFLCIK